MSTNRAKEDTELLVREKSKGRRRRNVGASAAKWNVRKKLYDLRKKMAYEDVFHSLCEADTTSLFVFTCLVYGAMIVLFALLYLIWDMHWSCNIHIYQPGHAFLHPDSSDEHLELCSCQSAFFALPQYKADRCASSDSATLLGFVHVESHVPRESSWDAFALDDTIALERTITCHIAAQASGAIIVLGQRPRSWQRSLLHTCGRWSISSGDGPSGSASKRR